MPQSSNLYIAPNSSKRLCILAITIQDKLRLYNIDSVLDLVLIEPRLPPPTHTVVQNSIVREQSQTPSRDKEQQSTIRPVPSWVSFRLLVSLINPNTHNLPRCSKGYVHRNRQSNCSRREQITAQPTQQWRNAAERPARRDDQTAVPRSVGVRR